LGAVTVTGIIGRRVCGRSQTIGFAAVSPFLGPGVSQVFSKAFTYLALAAGLSFPIVILAKSAKIVPVMLGQLLLGESSYGWRDFLFAALIVGGTVLLSSGGEDNTGTSSTFAGLLMIVLSLFMDGITAGLQKRHQKNAASNPPMAYDFLLFTSLSMIVIATIICMALGEFKEGPQFLNANPEAGILVLQCCLCSAVGQSFIYYIIACFDPLTCSTITTTRKLLSVMLSICFKGHNLNAKGMAGLGLALAGLVVEIDSKVSHHKLHHQKQMKGGRCHTIACSSYSDNGSLDRDNDHNGDIKRATHGRPLLQRTNSMKQHGRPQVLRSTSIKRQFSGADDSGDTSTPGTIPSSWIYKADRFCNEKVPLNDRGDRVSPEAIP
jgi:solute carrier family 35 (UDP-galactose transporter), member B1